MLHLPLTFLQRPAAATTPRPWLLVLMHGVGSNEQDLFSLASQIPDRFHVVSLRAPFRMGPGAHAWFDFSIEPNGDRSINGEQEARSRALAAQAVAAAADSAQQRALLVPLVEGRSKLALAYTEAESGPALEWVETRARRQGSGWVLDGRKTGVVGLPWAGTVIVSARIDGQPGDRDGIALFAVPATTGGVEIVAYARYDGLRSGELRLTGAQLDAGALLGEPARALDALGRAVDLATIAACADALGAMSAVLHKTGAYLATRQQFGAPLASFQVLQHRMVDMFAALEAARSMVVMAALHADAAPAERARAASAAKVAVGERARYVAQQGVQLHGGVGMTEELDIGHYFRRLTLFEKADGGIDHHLQRFAQSQRRELGTPR